MAHEQKASLVENKGASRYSMVHAVFFAETFEVSDERSGQFAVPTESVLETPLDTSAKA